ncbi:hypothetical protein NJ76_18045 [Rhodococcus sp. IITR03]|nr:hypothetical protein NJ76_18045 [Rhodococcus sp. IITR03]
MEYIDYEPVVQRQRVVLDDALELLEVAGGEPAEWDGRQRAEQTEVHNRRMRLTTLVVDPAGCEHRFCAVSPLPNTLCAVSQRKWSRTPTPATGDLHPPRYAPAHE